MEMELFQSYAKLAVHSGMNLQKGQTAVIKADVRAAEFVRMVAQECWLAGAGNVVVCYSDEACTRMRYEHGETERLCRIPNWELDCQMDYPKGEACYLNILSDDPDLLAGLPAEKLGKAITARKKAFKPFSEMINKGENQWCIIALPCEARAAKIFPNLPIEDAMEKLWQAIVTAVRLDTPDPVAAWRQHCDSLERYVKLLNNSKLRCLEFKNSLGTDLNLELAEGALWSGGGITRNDGLSYLPNMPTEEIFSMPHRARVNGKVVASMPLIYQGSVIDGFSITFRDGKVEDYTAEKGLDNLTQLLSVDSGAKRLGEVALVPYSSPIRRSGILFYNTLFDENAACHLALGSSYPDTMEGYAELTPEQREQRGFNDSATHVDFMFGTSDMSVTGITEDGKRIEIFRNGEWALD